MTDTNFTPPPPPGTPQLTARALFTGMLLGGVLSLCNLYTGLKVGWALNMSITAALSGYAFWRVWNGAFRGRSFNIYECNLNQTAASAAASISSAGLVAPIPALVLLTGQTMTWGQLVVWTFSVCLVGIIVAVGVRRQMIVVDRLPFPGGLATGQTLREIYATGSDAFARIQALAYGAIAAGLLKISEHLFYAGKRLSWPGGFTAQPGGALEQAGRHGVSWGNLGFALEPTCLMYGIGVLVGFRVGASILLGAILAWGILAPLLLEWGWVAPGDPDPTRSWFSPLLGWLLWPGVAMMVTSALTSFAFSWESIVRALRPSKNSESHPFMDTAKATAFRNFAISMVVVLIISVYLQVSFFAIKPWVAALGVLLTFLLALVAARVAGETNITPVGAMGKVTQLLFAIVSPGHPAANLMSANVTGGAASQCADMMHDLKTGQMIGARAGYQYIAQIVGALIGALAGSAAYLVLLPDPANQLLTDQWPAPAVAAWKAVAELFVKGISALPPGAVWAIIVAGAAGIILAVLEKTLPTHAKVWVPSPASLGLAFVIPAYNSLSFFIGSSLALALSKFIPQWSARFVIVLASGVLAGESLAGVGLALEQMLLGR